MIENKQTFLETIEESLKSDDFSSIKISKPSEKNSQYKNIFIKKITIKGEEVFNIIYNNKTQDITKNYALQELLFTCDELIWHNFKNAVLFTHNKDYTLSYNKKWVPKLTKSKATKSAVNFQHNKVKKRIIDTQNNIYLEKLWVINSNGVTINAKVWKLKQIHKFIETLSSSIKQSSLTDKASLKITDMWSGKWYLTFAVYDYIKNIVDKQVDVIWIEHRKGLVEKCNDIALESCFDNLSFIQWSIQDTEVETNDILIALHACDTATDDAIYKWIQSNSELIILSPCCHKQIRKEITLSEWLDSVIQHGIFKERQAEMVTDTLRWLFLELHWYKTKIFEYISDEHTHKNIMIVWIKHSGSIDSNKILDKVQKLKSIFWIKSYYLESKLKYKLKF